MLLPPALSRITRSMVICSDDHPAVGGDGAPPAVDDERVAWHRGMS
jgi:hypothetical protein